MGTKRKSTSAALEEQHQPKLQPESSDEETEYEEVEVEVSESEYESESAEEEQQPESESSAQEEEEEDTEDESTKRENIRKLLEPFTKDQIIQLFKSGASNDPSLLSRVTTLADTDPTHRKIFVHGLAYDATTEQLLAAFETYGEIEECKLITDKVTGRAKGYGFVLFKTRVGAKRALKEPQKKIGNRNTSCQLAAVGPAGGGPGTDTGGRKIYVGNVGPDVNSGKLRAFFEKFGEIEEGPLGFDKDSGKFKGFAILVFKSIDGANKALEEPKKLFDGCLLFCKKFVENLNNNSNNHNTASNSTNQVVQQNDGMGYGYGMSPGMLGGGSVNAVPLLMGQNMGFGVNSMLGFNPSFGGYGINGIIPGVVGSYGLQPAVQGLGAYQGAQLGQPSFGGTASMSTVTTLAKDSSGVGSTGLTYPSYLGR